MWLCSDHFLCNVVSLLSKKHLSINRPSFYIIVVLLQAFKSSFPLCGHPSEPPCVSQTPQSSAAGASSYHHHCFLFIQIVDCPGIVGVAVILL